MILHVAQGTLELLIQFLDDVVEEIVAQLFKQVSDLVQSLILPSRSVYIAASHQG
jgi:hypothetical protein